MLAKVAAAGPGHLAQRPDAATLSELADRLLQLSQAQETARATVGADEPDHARAFERLFAAVALLNPLHAAERIRKTLPPPR
jgi:hypothetical protein